MSKAAPETTSEGAPVPHDGSKQGTAPAHREPRSPTRPATTQDLIAQIWHTLEWHRTLQVAFIIAVSGITLTLVLAGLGLLAHASISQTASWPIGPSIMTATVGYLAARRRQR
jgi:hypothetical protein